MNFPRGKNISISQKETLATALSSLYLKCRKNSETIRCICIDQQCQCVGCKGKFQIFVCTKDSLSKPKSSLCRSLATDELLTQSELTNAQNNIIQHVNNCLFCIYKENTIIQSVILHIRHTQRLARCTGKSLSLPSPTPLLKLKEQKL